MTRLTNTIKEEAIEKAKQLYIKRHGLEKLYKDLGKSASSLYEILWSLAEGKEYATVHKAYLDLKKKTDAFQIEYPYVLNVNATMCNSVSLGTFGYSRDSKQLCVLHFLRNAIKQINPAYRVYELLIDMPEPKFSINCSHLNLTKFTNSPKFRNRREMGEFYHLLTKFEDHAKKMKRYIDQVSTALNSYTTVKKLTDKWPEAAELLPKPEAKPQLPAIPVAALNAQLGLPTDNEDL